MLPEPTNNNRGTDVERSYLSQSEHSQTRPQNDQTSLHTNDQPSNERTLKFAELPFITFNNRNIKVIRVSSPISLNKV